MGPKFLQINDQIESKTDKGCVNLDNNIQYFKNWAAWTTSMDDDVLRFLPGEEYLFTKTTHFLIDLRTKRRS